MQSGHFHFIRTASAEGRGRVARGRVPQHVVNSGIVASPTVSLEHAHRMVPSTTASVDSVAQIIRLYKQDVDRSLLRRQLSRTPEERFRDVMERQVAVEEFRRAGREARRSR